MIRGKYGSFEGKGGAGLQKAHAILYKSYVARCKETNTEPVSKEKWVNVNREYCDQLLAHIEEGHGYQLPAGLGFLRLGKRRFRATNRKASREQFAQLSHEEQQEAIANGGLYVTSLNWEHEGYYVAPIWDTSKTKFPNRSVFELRLVKNTFKAVNNRWNKDRTRMFKVINYKDHFK